MRATLALVLVSLAALLLGGCEKKAPPQPTDQAPQASATATSAAAAEGADPWVKMKAKHDELAALVEENQRTPAKGVAAAQQWFEKNEAEIKSLCEEQQRLSKKDPKYALIALEHLNDEDEAEKRIAAATASWSEIEKLKMATIQLDVAKACVIAMEQARDAG